MSIVHFGLAIMMVLVERSAINDGEIVKDHAAAHADPHAPAAHLSFQDGETSFLGLE